MSCREVPARRERSGAVPAPCAPADEATLDASSAHPCRPPASAPASAVIDGELAAALARLAASFGACNVRVVAVWRHAPANPPATAVGVQTGERPPPLQGRLL